MVAGNVPIFPKAGFLIMSSQVADPANGSITKDKKIMHFYRQKPPGESGQTGTGGDKRNKYLLLQP
jgi:hypothetical protein